MEFGVSVYTPSGNTEPGLGKLPDFLVTRDKTAHDKLLGTNYIETNYDFISKCKVAVDENRISVRYRPDGDTSDSLNIRYSNILNARLEKDRHLKARRERDILKGCDYIGLTIAESGNPSDQSPADYDGEVFYVYLIAQPDRVDYTPNINSSYHEKHGSHKDKTKISGLPSAKRADLESLYGEIRKEMTGELPEGYILRDPIERRAHLKVEGWQESGSQNVNADITGGVETTSKSSGVQVGPYMRSKSKSSGTVVADVDGSIENNTFSSEIDFIQVSEYGIFVSSDPILNFDYNEVDRLLKREKGITLEVGETAYTIVGPTKELDLALGKSPGFTHLDSPILDEAIDFIQKRLKETNEEPNSRVQDGKESSEKLRELKELHEDDILTDEEFENKKAELLEDF